MSIQAVVRIQTDFTEQVIELLQVESEFWVDSRQVAKGIGIAHDNFIQTLETHQAELEKWGLLLFQTGVKSGPQRGLLPKYVMLNRNQVLFAITLSRNTPQVVAWKMAMIDALDQLAKQLNRPGSQRQLPLLKAALSPEERKQRILAFVEKRKTVSRRDIQRALRMTAVEVEPVLAELQMDGMVSVRPIGRNGHCSTRICLLAGKHEHSNP